MLLRHTSKKTALCPRKQTKADEAVWIGPPLRGVALTGRGKMRHPRPRHHGKVSDCRVYPFLLAHRFLHVIHTHFCKGNSPCCKLAELLTTFEFETSICILLVNFNCGKKDSSARLTNRCRTWPHFVCQCFI